jgi:hypothetical protein
MHLRSRCYFASAASLTKFSRRTYQLGEELSGRNADGVLRKRDPSGYGVFNDPRSRVPSISVNHGATSLGVRACASSQLWRAPHVAAAKHVLLLQRVDLRVLEYNERAIRCYLKCGFVEEAREATLAIGAWLL